MWKLSLACASIRTMRWLALGSSLRTGKRAGRITTIKLFGQDQLALFCPAKGVSICPVHNLNPSRRPQQCAAVDLSGTLP